MHFDLLANRADAVPVVARWYFDEWGHSAPESSFEKTCESLQSRLNRDRIPLLLLAIEGDRVVGAAELKPHEMLSVYPEKEPWLGGVFVAPESRGKGIASQLAARIAGIARAFGVEQLYLQTTALDGGLYARLGWRPLEQVHYRGEDVLLMVNRLS
jgi:GNAT superfamily N-acetyltransferase